MSLNINIINTLQLQLKNLLGENYNAYQEIMKDWFGQKTTKDFFDERMGEILTVSTRKLHNEMMKQIIFHSFGIEGPPPDLPADLLIDPQTTMPVDVESSSLVSSTQVMKTEEVPEFKQTRVIILRPGEDRSNLPQDCITINLLQTPEMEDWELRARRIGLAIDPEPEEEVEPILPVDWLFDVESTDLSLEDVIQHGDALFNDPSPFEGEDLLLPGSTLSSLQQPSQHVMPNISHAYDIAERLNKLPHLKSHFKVQPLSRCQYYLRAGASLHGKFLMKAWEVGLGSVEPQSTELLISAVNEHIKKLVLEIIKQRRSFRMRNDKVIHSIGAPLPNPYLRQTDFDFMADNIYSSDSTKMADAMQVPKMMHTGDELERMAALQVAATVPKKQCRFPATRGTLADLLNVIENDPCIIPHPHLRYKVHELIALEYKGYGGTHGSAVSSTSDNDDTEFEDEDEGRLLPVCSY